MISKPRVWIVPVITFLICTSILSAQPSFSAVKAGTSCTKVGQTTISSNKKFTCIKSGKKLIWNKGVATRPTPSATTASIEPQKPLDQHQEVVNQVQAEWKEWVKKANKSFTPLKLIVEPGYEPNFSSAPIKAANILIASMIGNGHLLLQDPISIIGDSEDWLQKTGSVYSCGNKIPDQELGIYCGHVQAGFGYFVLNAPNKEKFADGKLLTSSQITILNYMVVHDIATMYELQAQYGSEKYNGIKVQIPAWIREGFAQLFASLSLAESLGSNKSYFDVMTSSNLLEPFPKTLCPKTLQDFESKNRNWGGSCAYSQNFYGVELLVAKHGGLESLFKFVSLFGTTDDWPTSFKTAFGISREDFYEEWYDYLKIPKADRPALTAPAPSVRY